MLKLPVLGTDDDVRRHCDRLEVQHPRVVREAGDRLEVGLLVQCGQARDQPFERTWPRRFAEQRFRNRGRDVLRFFARKQRFLPKPDELESLLIR